ncbi:MAG: MarR family winged helix-turn-helix transcriptional regulator [Streptosporangiaceae bacterium]
MHSDMIRDPPGEPADLTRAEAGLSVLAEAWQRAVEQLGSVTPPAQLRALLIVDGAGTMNLTRLARMLGASTSATSKLCDRLVAAGLLARGPAASSRREITLGSTESGHRVAQWVREQRRAALDRTLASLSPEGRRDLARGLAELARLV